MCFVLMFLIDTRKQKNNQESQTHNGRGKPMGYLNKRHAFPLDILKHFSILILKFERLFAYLEMCETKLIE